MKAYLDYHSSTPVDKRIIAKMNKCHLVEYGNPSAIHSAGESAKELVEKATIQVAEIIGALPEQIIFTAGATESNNITIKGRWFYFRRVIGKEKIKIISSKIEHDSVLQCVNAIQRYDENVIVVNIPVSTEGELDLRFLEEELQKDDYPVLLVSLMTANNEIGTINDIIRIGSICKKYDVFFHTDATQAVGKIDIDVNKSNTDALSLSAHKIYGPKGIGALFVRDSNIVDPFIDGGYQSMLRSGTLNTAGIVGLGMACELLKNNGVERVRTEQLRDWMLHELTTRLDGITVNGIMEDRLCNNLNISIEGVLSEIIVGLDDIMVSSGSACATGNHEPSHVLREIQAKNPDCAIRFGLGRWTTFEEVDYAVARIVDIVKKTRAK